VTRILLDQNVPFPLIRHLPGHEVIHTSTVGLGELVNGLLLAAAEERGFDLLITCDQNLEYQQNLSGRRIALIVLSTNTWMTIRVNLPPVIEAVKQASVGSYRFLAFDRPPLRRRPFSRTPDC
jgi:hypothetical protein